MLLVVYVIPMTDVCSRKNPRHTAVAFWVASLLTHPICKVQECFWLLRVSRISQGVVFWISTLGKMIFALVLSIPLTMPGVIVRWVAIRFAREPFLYEKGNGPLYGDAESVTLLSWNVCFISGGYPITDGGVMPWVYRMKGITDSILESNPDILCLYEVFDVHAALLLIDNLRDMYAHFYYNIGPKAVGVSSGFFVAARYEISDLQFVRFPKTMLVGRTKYAAKGLFSFEIRMKNSPLVIVCSHLQHSEEPAFPTNEEIFARKEQASFMVSYINRVYPSKKVLVNGDLNMDEGEYVHSAFGQEFPLGKGAGKKSWGGDEFCARLVGKRSSQGMNLDYVVGKNVSIEEIEFIETGYEASLFKRSALSDHRGIMAVLGGFK